jgi:hypothetical protein
MRATAQTLRYGHRPGYPDILRDVMHPLRSTLLAAVAVALGAGSATAQQPATPAAPVGPQVGDVAPDFTIVASDKDGVRKKPFRLADAKGNTVVLAFFPKARTKG